MPVKTNNEVKGRIVWVPGRVVEFMFTTADDVPNIYSVLTTQNIDKEDVTLEVAEHLPGNLARCIAINSTTNLQRNAEAKVAGTTIRIPDGEAIYGRIINVLGQPIDQKGPITSLETFPI
ncbi:MAG: F0F1 ATP synthase subunit beta, partial [Candidatus Omnitrophica bacterium]|nr:F0F1 ATP synthase subunit beta [Candidatus Omnitrophota bacterium]